MSLQRIKVKWKGRILIEWTEEGAEEGEGGEYHSLEITNAQISRWNIEKEMRLPD